MKRARRELIAFQGERGAFSQEAARKLLGPDVEVLPCQRFEDIFRNVKEGVVFDLLTNLQFDPHELKGVEMLAANLKEEKWLPELLEKVR